ncbi:MAG: patatin-like phospholipase family protein [Elusimicrobia bacterium]|nr:patatin-like phospholipase family protein [Elusimicrobiota bacterium]
MDLRELPIWEPFLRKHRLFADLDKKHLQTIALKFLHLSLPKESILYHQGDPADTFYLIVSGQVRVSAAGDPKPRLLAHLGRGDILGEMSLLTEESRPATAELETDAEFLTLSKKDLDRVLKENPELTLHLSRLLSRRLLHAFQAGSMGEKNPPQSQSIALLAPVPKEEKNLVIAGLAVSLVEQARRRVILLDLDSPPGETAKLLSLSAAHPPHPKLSEVELRDPEWIKSWAQIHPSGLGVLSLSPAQFEEARIPRIFPLLNLLRDLFDFTLISLPGTLDALEKTILEAADRIVLVSSSRHPQRTAQAKEKMGTLWSPRKEPLQISIEEEPGPAPMWIADLRHRLPWPQSLQEALRYNSSLFKTLLKYPKTQRAIDHIARTLAHLRIGLVMGSGAALGHSLAGVLKVLEKEHIFPDIVAGTSMGAAVGALYACGRTSLEIEEIAISLTKRRVWESILADLTLPRSGIMAGSLLTRFFRRYLGYKEFQDLELPFACVTTDILTGEEVVLSEGRVVEAVRASCTIPILFSPFYYRRRFLCDGGLVNPVPTSVASKLGADVILAVNLTRPPSERRTFPLPSSFLLRTPHLGHVLFNMIYTMQYGIAQSRTEVADVLIRPNLTGFDWTQFHRGKELLEVGEQAAEAAMPKIKALLPFFSDFCRAPIRLPAIHFY